MDEIIFAIVLIAIAILIANMKDVGYDYSNDCSYDEPVKFNEDENLYCPHCGYSGDWQDMRTHIKNNCTH